MINCRNIEFSAEKASLRFTAALRVFKPTVLYRIVAFVLFLLGAKRTDIAKATNMPVESVKTLLRVINRDGFHALRDRRRTDDQCTAIPVKPKPRISVQRQGDCCLVEFYDGLKMEIPLSHQIQIRTILLSLLNAKLISTKDTADILGICEAYCRELAGKLTYNDIPEALLDKRQGQMSDYRVGSEEKAELILQFAALAVTGHSTSSEILAQRVSEKTLKTISPRTIRWHMNKLGLNTIKSSLPALVDALKKTADDSS